MKSFNRSGLWLAFIAALSFFISCSKFVDIDPAPDLIDTHKVFESDATATAALNGVYVKMRSISLSLTNGGMSLYTALSSDELYNTAASTIYDPFFKDSLPVDNNTVLRNFWTEPYANIYRLNAIIEGLNTSVLLTDSVKKQLLGEAKFLRSLHYFYMSNLFGDLPLITSTDYRLNQSMPRTPKDQVLQFIVTELTDAGNLLSAYYPGNTKARVNKWAATALLARVYLFQQNWSQAQTTASAVINSGKYNLETNLQNVFLKNNPETIFEMAPPNESGNTAEGANFIPSTATTRPPLALTSSLMNSFQPGDKRKTSWTKSNTVSSIVYFYPYKYKVKSATTVSEYNIVLRLAEQYLIRAEAWAHTGNLLSATTDLNTIRTRAGLPNTTATSKDSILIAIESEKMLEYFTEWGHRWIDLKRTGRADFILGARKSSWSSFAALYPIPYSQLLLNPQLTQNPGY